MHRMIGPDSISGMHRVMSCSLALALTALSVWKISDYIRKKSKKNTIQFGFLGLIGDTPLIELKSLSEATGCRILAKVEFMNPGGSSKDRIAKGILEEAERQGILKSDDVVVEGTSGSTGISLALACNAKGYKCVIVMPDDVAMEKQNLLRRLGATLKLVKPASIANPKHYVNEARRQAKQIPGGFFANQFENLANYRIHYETTGPEIWSQTNGALDAFVMSCGTGGTMAGVSRYLKERNRSIKIYLADPPGSSLYNKVKSGVCYAPQQAETRIRRHRYDTIVEGVGIDRLTDNFLLASIDDAIFVTDHEMLEMSRFLLREEGLFLGSSSALNCVAAVRAARELGPAHTVLTILCDSGQRHLTKFWNDQHLINEWNLKSTSNSLDFLDQYTGHPKL